MWGTTSTSAQLTGNFAGAPEDTSIGDRRLVRLLAGKLGAQRFGTGPVGLVRTQKFGIQSEKPTLDGVPARSSTSVFGGTADIAFQAGHVGSGPEADIDALK